MSELSQAERTVMEKAFNNLATWTDPYVRAKAIWRSGRDYGRERERALRQAIEDAASDASLCDSAEKLEALTHRLLSIAASPGEPEGQRDGIVRVVSLAERYGEAIVSISAALNADDLDDRGRIMRARGVIAGLDKSQPAHGPGQHD